MNIREYQTRLYGNYENLHAGFTTKALQDLTGGIVQVIKQQNVITSKRKKIPCLGVRLIKTDCVYIFGGCYFCGRVFAYLSRTSS